MARVAAEKKTGNGDAYVAVQTEQGFKVYSPADPKTLFLVTGSAEAPRCTCAEFQHHANDAAFRCPHVRAVESQLHPRTGEDEDAYAREERLAIQSEEPLSPPAREYPSANGAQMAIKRSVSPDGKINALSIEVSFPVDTETSGEIRARALKAITLQREIAENFLGNGNGHPRGNERKPSEGADSADGAVPARMLSVEGMNTRWGWRHFISVNVDGETLKLFGNRKQLAEYVTNIGFPEFSTRIAKGTRLNLPCRVVTKPSEDGKYVNIEQVFPMEASRSAQRSRP